MNTKTIALAGLLLGGLLAPAVYSAEKNTPAATATAPGAVGKALAKLKTVNKVKPKKNAKYYLCLYSASWCGPCCKEMPNVVKIYNDEIKKNPDVELVLFSQDRTAAAAKQWLTQNKAKFPALDPKDLAKVPGMQQPGGIPHMYIIDSEGKVLKDGYPSSILATYKDTCKSEAAAAN